jgi:hypothetical protein
VGIGMNELSDLTVEEKQRSRRDLNMLFGDK